MIMKEEFYKHYLQVVSSAMQSARSIGVAIHTISLLGFDLPYDDLWQAPDLSSLSVPLRQLLEHIKVLRLRESDRALELLSHCALGLYQLDMCRVVVANESLKDFLKANKKTIQFIGFHNVTISTLSRLGSDCPMTASILCNVLDVPALCQAADCGCVRWRKEGSRLLMNHDRLLRSARTSAKRKFDD
jgi:hypothetical protein